MSRRASFSLSQMLWCVSSAILILLFTACAKKSKVERMVGCVQDFEGRWLLDKSEIRRAGQQLPSGGVITNPSPSENDYITISDMHGVVRNELSRSCKVLATCNDQIQLPQAEIADVRSVMYEAVMSLIWEKPDSYVQARVRGGTALPAFPDGVVPLDGQEIDLSSILKSKDTHRYLLSLREVSRHGNAGNNNTLGPITFEWNDSKPTVLTVPGITPGVYELTLLEQAGEDYRVTNSPCWILITTQRNYANVRREFLKMTALTEKWNNAVRPEKKQSFLRASLDYLATKEAK